MSPRVTAVSPLPDYKIRVVFDDGAAGVVELAYLLGRGVFKAWIDPTFFQSVGIDPETGTVCWPGGIDLCPDNLYHKVTGKPLPGQTLRRAAS